MARRRRWPRAIGRARPSPTGARSRPKPPGRAAGRGPRAALSSGREFAGKTLGLVGFGAIGQLTARSAAALGVRTMACDALLGADHPAFAQTGTQPVGLDELVAQADVVSLH